jgi:hypothetical protein
MKFKTNTRNRNIIADVLFIDKGKNLGHKSYISQKLILYILMQFVIIFSILVSFVKLLRTERDIIILFYFKAINERLLVQNPNANNNSSK